VPAADPSRRRGAPPSRPPRLTLTVQYGIGAAALPARSTLRRWARAALERDARVTLRFAGTREAATLNAVYRGKDYATNVLTFVYDDADALAGDIVLCPPVLRREAKAQGKAFPDHCAHLVVHGMLHLQGYEHDNARAARTMERRETAILAALRLPDPWAGPPAGRSARA
jgi:probable rRNA maturation factor